MVIKQQEELEIKKIGSNKKQPGELEEPFLILDA